MKLEDLFGEGLMERIANGEAELNISVTGGGDDGEECSEDSCPIAEGKKEEEKEPENDGEFMKLLLDLIFGGHEEEERKEDEELKEARQEAVESYNAALKELGKDRADAMIKLSTAEATIQACIEEKIPIRTKDVEAYNSMLEKVLPDRSAFVIALRYARIDKSMADGTTELLEVLGK